MCVHRLPLTLNWSQASRKYFLDIHKYFYSRLPDQAVASCDHMTARLPSRHVASALHFRSGATWVLQQDTRHVPTSRGRRRRIVALNMTEITSRRHLCPAINEECTTYGCGIAASNCQIWINCDLSTIFDCAVLSSTLQAGEMDSVPCSAALAALCVKTHR